MQWDFIQFKVNCDFIKLSLKGGLFTIILPILLEFYFNPLHVLFSCHLFFQAVFIMHSRIIQNFSRKIFFPKQSGILFSGMFFILGFRLLSLIASLLLIRLLFIPDFKNMKLESPYKSSSY